MVIETEGLCRDVGETETEPVIRERLGEDKGGRKLCLNRMFGWLIVHQVNLNKVKSTLIINHLCRVRM